MRQHHKRSPAGRGKSARPNDAQLEAINRLALAELTADQVYVRTAYLGHNGIDRDREVLDDGLLADFARTLPGKGLYVRHPHGWDGDSGPGLGRWFEAKVVEMSLAEARTALREPGLQFPPGTERARLLAASSYIPHSAKNADLILDIDAGVAGDLSLGFTASDRRAIQDPISGDTLAYRLLGPGEALEGSLVWLGAQPGARMQKAAGGLPDYRPGVAPDYSNPVANPLVCGGGNAEVKRLQQRHRRAPDDALRETLLKAMSNPLVVGADSDPGGRPRQEVVQKGLTNPLDNPLITG